MDKEVREALVKRVGGVRRRGFVYGVWAPSSCDWSDADRFIA